MVALVSNAWGTPVSKKQPSDFQVSLVIGAVVVDEAVVVEAVVDEVVDDEVLVVVDVDETVFVVVEELTVFQSRTGPTQYVLPATRPVSQLV